MLPHAHICTFPLKICVIITYKERGDMIQRICGIDISVEVTDPSLWAENAMGRTSQKSDKILICSGMTKETTNSTNVHEVVHMILDMNGFHEATGDEKMVAVVANGLFAWMRYNPCVHEWFKEKEFPDEQVYG